MESIGFSKFRSLMDIWDLCLLEQEEENRIKQIINDNGLILFFKKDQEYFGTNEEGRIIFAKIKNNDEDLPKGWDEEATFTVCNLSKMVKGEPSKSILGKKDIKKIRVIEEEELIESLKNISFNKEKENNNIKILNDKNKDKKTSLNRTDED